MLKQSENHLECGKAMYQDTPRWSTPEPPPLPPAKDLLANYAKQRPLGPPMEIPPSKASFVWGMAASNALKKSLTVGLQRGVA